MSINLRQEISDLLKQVDKILSLASEGLLKSERLSETKYKVEDKLKELSNNFDENDQLLIEKNIPKLRNLPKHGIFVDSNQAINKITPLRTLLFQLLAKQPNHINKKMKPKVSKILTESELIKKINENIIPMKEGLLKFDEFNGLCLDIIIFLNNKIKDNKIWQLRFRKFNERYNRGLINVDQYDYVSIDRSFEAKSGWDHFEPFYIFLLRYVNEGKIINRLEDNHLWVESRVDDKTTHMFIGDRLDSKKKVHLIFSGETGETRIDKNDTPPSELLTKVEHILTTKEGKIIKSVMEFEG